MADYNLKNKAHTLLATVSAVDLNITTKQTLFTCPAGSSCVIDSVVVRNASGNVTTANYGFGWDAGAANIVAHATHTELTGSTLFTKLSAKAGATLGLAAEAFGLKCTTGQGSAMTCTVDVFGYLI